MLLIIDLILNSVVLYCSLNNVMTQDWSLNTWINYVPSLITNFAVIR